MQEDTKTYHVRRAATQRRLAAQCDDPGVAKVHRTLAGLHEARADEGATRPKLHMVMPG